MASETAKRGRRLWHWVIGLSALAAALIGIAILSLLAFRQAVGNESVRTAADARQTRSFEIILSAEQAYSALQDAERGQRGYVLTENSVFLDPYTEAGAAVLERVDALAALVADSPEQGARVDVLRRLADLKLAEMQRVVQQVSEGDIAGARQEISSGYGRRLMVQVRDVMDEIREAEQRRLAARQQAVRASDAAGARSIYRFALIGTALLIASVVAVIALAFMVNRTRIALDRERDSEAHRELLEAAVARRTLELTRANERLMAEAQSRESAEHRLRQAQRMEAVGQLTGGIAHDFNNMLAVVIGSLDLLRRRVGEEPRLVRLIDNAAEGANRAASLTARLLAFSRQQSLKPEAVDVNQLVSGLQEFLRRTLGEQIRIEIRPGTDVPPIFADTSELENVIINLAANARDAMPGGGRLLIETGRREITTAPAGPHDPAPGTYARIAVSDTGEGMSEEVRARVFEPFFTTKPVGRGTGLGLSQVHGFVHQSGGAIDLRSTIGEGTCIEILLPEGEDGEDIRPLESDLPAHLPEAKPGEIILVVEDQEQLRALNIDVLRELGYEVRQAASGPDALQALAEAPRVHLLFTDIVMPDMSGEELARRALEGDPEVKILYTSGYTQAAGVDPSALDPHAELLRKPFTVQELAITIRRTLDA